MKTTIIHHSADFDGLFSGQIAKKFLPDAEVIGWDFGDAPLSSSMLTSDRVYILDLPVDQVFGLKFKDGWICRGEEQVQPIDRWDSSNVVWIDHHGSSIASHPTDIPGYRIDGVAACRLAWQWFTTNEHNAQNATNEALQLPLPAKADFINRAVCEPLAVRWAGEYDIWDKRDNCAEVFQFGLRSKDLTDEDWRALFSDEVLNKGTGMDARESDVMATTLLQNGFMLQRYQQRNDAGVVNFRSFLQPFDGLTFLALNTARCNSLTFAAKDVPETGHDALMGFYWTGKSWKVSLYHAKHRTDLDLSKIAVKFGGGGHRGACGFECKGALPFCL